MASGFYIFLWEKKESWNVYRSYAWLGFWANYVFIVTTLLSILTHNVLYPKDVAETYFGNIENAKIIQSHPTAQKRILDNKTFLNQLQKMEQGKIVSDQWSNDIYLEKRNELFPYLLIGTKAKWGSGLNTQVYIEENGKGILVTTSKSQHYFRSEVSFLEGGE